MLDNDRLSLLEVDLKIRSAGGGGGDFLSIGVYFERMPFSVLTVSG